MSSFKVTLTHCSINKSFTFIITATVKIANILYYVVDYSNMEIDFIRSVDDMCRQHNQPETGTRLECPK